MGEHSAVGGGAGSESFRGSAPTKTTDSCTLSSLAKRYILDFLGMIKRWVVRHLAMGSRCLAEMHIQIPPWHSIGRSRMRGAHHNASAFFLNPHGGVGDDY